MPRNLPIRYIYIYIDFPPNNFFDTFPLITILSRNNVGPIQSPLKSLQIAYIYLYQYQFLNVNIKAPIYSYAVYYSHQITFVGFTRWQTSIPV